MVKVKSIKTKRIVVLILLIVTFSQILSSQNSRVFSVETANKSTLKISPPCWEQFKEAVNKSELSEEERVGLVKYALNEISEGHCGRCPRVALRLLRKSDLIPGSNIRDSIEKLIYAKSNCIIYLLPKLINEFQERSFEAKLEEIYSRIYIDADSISLYQRHTTLQLIEQLMVATLYSNTGIVTATDHVIKILSIFNNREYADVHRELLEVVIICDPVSVRLVKTIFTQGIMRRKDNMNIKTIDEVLPDYQKELLRLKTVVEWNEYKNKHFDLSPKKYYKWTNWTRDGTLDFINHLMTDGFTIKKRY